MISVLMCTYNRERLLPRAIDSVLNQTYKDIEFVIIDDGSTDATEQLIRSYEDKRIIYKKLEKNSFYCYAANYGLQFCKGEYLAFMNSDDIWLPEKLEKQIQFLEEHREYEACFTAAFLIDAAGNDITDVCTEMRDSFGKQYASQKECIQYLLNNKNTLCHPSALVRKEIMDRVGGFNLMFCQLADYDLWTRIVTEGPVHVMEERLIKFQWDMKAKDQISIATKENAIRAFNEQVLIKKHLIERLTDEKLIEFFGEQFRNKNSKTHLELEFERAFLMMECLYEARDLKVLGMEKLEQLMQNPEAMQVLREHFQLNIFELYAWNKANMYQTPWAENPEAELKVEELKLTVNHYHNLMDQLNRDKELLENDCKEHERVSAELQQLLTDVQQNHKKELELTENHYHNLMAQLRNEKILIENSYSELQQANEELQRIHMEVQQNLKKELELTVNHYHNLMAQWNAEKEELKKDCNELQQDNAGLKVKVEEKESLIYSYENSTSWKMTAPFRKFMRMLKK